MAAGAIRFLGGTPGGREPVAPNGDVNMARGSLDALVRTSAALRGVAVAPVKLANDMR